MKVVGMSRSCQLMTVLDTCTKQKVQLNDPDAGYLVRCASIAS
jgi:hypothetical protein